MIKVIYSLILIRQTTKDNIKMTEDIKASWLHRILGTEIPHKEEVDKHTGLGKYHS